MGDRKDVLCPWKFLTTVDMTETENTLRVMCTNANGGFFSATTAAIFGEKINRPICSITDAMSLANDYHVHAHFRNESGGCSDKTLRHLNTSTAPFECLGSESTAPKEGGAALLSPEVFSKMFGCEYDNENNIYTYRFGGTQGLQENSTLVIINVHAPCSPSLCTAAEAT